MLWSSLIYDSGILRGSSFRTKTSTRGMPFALQGIGLYGDWAAPFLTALDPGQEVDSEILWELRSERSWDGVCCSAAS